MDMENYRVLTKESVLDLDTLNTEATMALINEQNALLADAGMEDTTRQCYIIRFFESAFRNERIDSLTIEDAVQCLAIKEGYDLVTFEDGHIGFVAYYNDHKDGFEILTIDTGDMYI